MHIFICDDDPDFIAQLEKYIFDFFRHINLKLPKIKSYTNGESLLLDSIPMDIVFLDVEMPGLDGIVVGQKLKEKNPNIIIFIITSYVEYLDDAMRFHVFRYLSKPLDKQRLFRNMQDALRLYNSTNIHIPIETKGTIYNIPAADILCVEAQNPKIIIHTLQQDYTVLYNMDYWEKVLNFPFFFRSHRSFIVNLQHVTSFNHTLIYLGNNCNPAYLTRRKYTQFKEAYFLYLESMR